jgi:hypothetical protein
VAFGIRALAALLMTAPSAAAGERFAIVVAGASGGEVYAAHHEKWSADLGDAFRTTFKFPAANVVVLSGHGEGTSRSTSANVKALLGDLRRRVTAGDVVLLVLIGHGTFDGEDAKFNLVGPDLTAHEWKQQLLALPARTVVVNTTASRIGKEADAPGEDGAFARTVYLDPGTTPAAADEARAALEEQRRTLEAQIEVLKGRKAEMPAGEYSAELERLLLQLARVSQQIRQRS